MKKRVLKIMAFLAAVALIAGISILGNSLVGNPISKMLAEKTAKEHLEENYKDTDYYLERISFNFKTIDYQAYIESPSSADSSFTLSIGMTGKLILDDYEGRVIDRWNTASRIDTEYMAAVRELLNSNAFSKESCSGYGMIEFISRQYANEPDVPDYALITNDLELDALYDLKELGSKAGYVSVDFYDNTVSVERLSELMLQVKEHMEQAGLSFYVIDCVLTYPKSEDGTWSEERVEVLKFLYSDIYEEGMVERVREANEKAIQYHNEQDSLKKE